MQNESAKVTRGPAREASKASSQAYTAKSSIYSRFSAVAVASYIFLLPVLFSQSLDAIVISPEASLSTYTQHLCTYVRTHTRRPNQKCVRPSSLFLPAFCMRSARRRVTAQKRMERKTPYWHTLRASVRSYLSILPDAPIFGRRRNALTVRCGSVSLSPLAPKVDTAHIVFMETQRAFIRRREILNLEETLGQVHDKRRPKTGVGGVLWK